MKLPLRLVCFAAIAALVLVACAEPVKVAPEQQPSFPSTPQSLVKLFEWAVNQHNAETLRAIFTEDFTCVGVTQDSSGNPLREVICRREDMLERFLRPTTALSFDQNLVPMPDTRPGYVDSLFQTIRTSVDLKEEVDGVRRETTGYALLYLVRGDTAAIPAELLARGFRKDGRRWWLARWEDETIASEGP
jgi:hypothetical protein